MFLRFPLVFLLVLMLSACGGCGCLRAGDVENMECNEPRIQLFGDSTMAGAAIFWQELFGERIESRAKGGGTTTKLLTGTDGRNEPWPRPVAAPYYVVNFGLNDAGKPSRGGISVDQYKANLRVLATAPNSRAIFQTPNPATSVGREDVGIYANAMRQVAREYNLPVIDVYACFQRQPDWRDRLPDGTHPDEQGYRYIVDVCVEPVITMLPCERQ
jgi:lysophospholipase L1-like esterase